MSKIDELKKKVAELQAKLSTNPAIPQGLNQQRCFPSNIDAYPSESVNNQNGSIFIDSKHLPLDKRTGSDVLTNTIVSTSSSTLPLPPPPPPSLRRSRPSRFSDSESSLHNFSPSQHWLSSSSSTNSPTITHPAASENTDAWDALSEKEERAARVRLTHAERLQRDQDWIDEAADTNKHRSRHGLGDSCAAVAQMNAVWAALRAAAPDQELIRAAGTSAAIPANAASTSWELAHGSVASSSSDISAAAGMVTGPGSCGGSRSTACMNLSCAPPSWQGRYRAMGAGHTLLLRMGWREGEGLGRGGLGRRDAVLPTPGQGRSGLGMRSQKDLQAARKG